MKHSLAVRQAAEALRRPQFVCRRCRLQTRRTIQTSAPSQAIFDSNSMFGRVKNFLSGSKEAEVAKEERDKATEAKKEKVEAGQEKVVRKIRVRNKEYDVASTIVSTSHPEYKAATTWDGLESIGSEEWIKAQLDQGEVYISFIRSEKVALSTPQWKALLRHVLVEALVLMKNQIPASDICRHRRPGSKPWEVTSAARVTVDNGTINIRFANSEHEQALLDTFVSQLAEEQEFHDEVPAVRESLVNTASVGEASASNETVQAEIAQQQDDSAAYVEEFAPADIEDTNTHLTTFLESVHAEEQPLDSWMTVSLKDSRLKFAIVKRITQLTGVRLPDMAISDSADIRGLYYAALVKPKPKKLLDSTQVQQLTELPNVTIHNKRWTAVDKDKEEGRWKLIEEELIRRDLPLTGTTWIDSKLTTQT